MERWLAFLRGGTRHVGWPLADQALVSGSNFLIGVLLVRAFDLDTYGVFVLLWAAVQFAQSLQNALLISPMMSIGSGVVLDRQAEYFSAVAIWMVLFACATAGLLLVAAEITNVLPSWWKPEYGGPLALWALAAQVQDGLRRILFSRRLYRGAFLVDCVAYVGQLLAVLGLSWLSYKTAALIWAIALVFLLSTALAVAWLRLHWVSGAVLGEVWNRHWTSSRWLLGASLFQWFSGNLVLVTAAGVFGPAFTGAVRAAQNIFGMTHVVFQALENIVPAGAACALAQQGVNGLRTYLNRVAASILLGTILLSAVIAVFAERLLLLVYKGVSEVSLISIYWYVPIYVIIALGLPLRTALRALEKTRAIFIGYGIGAACAFLVARYAVGAGGVNTVMAGILVVQIATLAPIAFSAISRTRQWAPPQGAQ